MRKLNRLTLTLALLLMAAGGAWAQSANPEVIELKPDETGKNWILANMPASNIELQVEYEPTKVTMAANDNAMGTVEVAAGSKVEWTADTWKGWTYNDKEYTVGDITMTSSKDAFIRESTEEDKYKNSLSFGVIYTTDKSTVTFSTTGDPFSRIEFTMIDDYSESNPNNPHILPNDNWTFEGKSAVWEGEATKSLTLQSCSTNVSKITFFKDGDIPDGVTVNGDGTFTVAKTATVTLKATPAEGYKLKGWSDAPDCTDLVREITIEPGEEDMIITAIFEEMTYTATFNAANANTIEAGKATVTVGGTAATVTEGKLEGVKMGTEVKVTAKEGYKFRKVEVKKAASGPEVTTFSELQTALSAGKDVKLMNDIVCTAEIEITNDGALTIDGNGKKLSTTSAIRAFKVGSSATVAFKNLTLTGFVSGGGPAINNSGTIVLDGCTISNCHVNNSNGGGAIENKGKLYAINTTFSGNYSGEIGGAINNYTGSLYMSNCTFTNNYTTSSNAFYGGAIGINRGSEVRLINCSFSGNKYGTNTGTNDIGVYWNPTSYTIAGCTGATIASDGDDITTNTTGTATLDYSDLSNISFTYNAE